MKRVFLTSGLGILAALCLIVAMATQSSAVERDDDVDTSAEYEYRVDSEAGVVNVTITLEVTADKPNRTTRDGSVYQYYFQGIPLILPSDGEDLTVTDSAGRALEYVVEEEVDDVQVIIVDFRRNLFHRQTTTVVAKYTMAGGEARSNELHRVNQAHVGFSMWVDPTLEEVTVAVVAPEGFEDLSESLNNWDQEVIDGDRWFRFTPIDSEFFWAVVALTDEDELDSTEVEILGHEIEIRSWPGDDDWTDNVEDNLQEGLPTLIDTVGLPWPVGDDLVILESYTPYLVGYGGWFDQETTQIDIGDELDDHLVFHEVSHVWFNGDLFDMRWITEGLADEFAADAVESLGQTRPKPERTSLADGSAQQLNLWTLYAEAETEAWSYGASWTVTKEIAEKVGMDVMSEVLQAAAAEEIAYLGDGPAEPRTVRPDWRLYLDLLENRGEVTDDDLSELFEDWVLPNSQLFYIENRTESRATYAALDETGDGWAPPLVVRTAMSAWKFPDANRLMVEAGAVLEERDGLTELAAQLGASLPPVLEESYESAGEDFTEVTEQLGEVETTVQKLLDTSAGIDDATGILEQIGAIGTDLPADLAAAVVLVGSNELEDANAQAAAIDQEVAELSDVGQTRLITAGGVLLIVLALLLWLFVRRRRARQSKRDAALSPVSSTAPQTVGIPVSLVLPL